MGSEANQIKPKREQANCPACGKPIATGWRFCAACGCLLDGCPQGENAVEANSEQCATPISPVDLPNVSGVPGRIIGVKISHGWAAACGYYDIHEVTDGFAVKSRRADSARGGGRFPEGWFDEYVEPLDDGHQMRLAAILQNVRYCDIGRNRDGTTVVEPRDRNLFMRITYEDADGSFKTFDVHADAEYGQDIGSQRARDVIRVIEGAFGNRRVVDSLLVIHRKGPILRVVMNAPLYLTPGPSIHGNTYSVVDCDSDDVLTLEVNELGADARFLEARVYGLRDGWTSYKAMFQIEDGAVVRLPPESFAWEGWWDEAMACGPKNRLDSPEWEEWIIACATWPYGFEKRIDVAPFLEGYEPLGTSGSYAVTTWLEEDDEGRNAWFERPLPEKVELIDPPPRPTARGVGTFSEHRDMTLRTIARHIQLEESRYYFLTVYFNEDGTPTGKYSFDMEGAHDSHYLFTESEVPRLRQLMGASGAASLADDMIAFLHERTGGELSGLVRQIKTESISY